jgi:hypothetical protein
MLRAQATSVLRSLVCCVFALFCGEVSEFDQFARVSELHG